MSHSWSSLAAKRMSAEGLKYGHQLKGTYVGGGCLLTSHDQGQEGRYGDSLHDDEKFVCRAVFE